MRRRWLALLACVFLTFSGCAGDDPARESPEPAEGEPGSGPALSIVTPENDSTIEAGDVDVEVDVDNFDVAKKLGEPAVQGEGHVHYYFDVDELPTTPGKPAVTADAKTYHAAATTSHTWKDVEAGEHTFGVQLVNNDHTPLEPPVTEEVTVTVE